LIWFGQEFKVLVEEFFLDGATFSSVFTSVGLVVRRWDTDIVGTFGVIDTTRSVFTVSVVSDTDVTSTWVLVVTFFIEFTLWFVVAFLLSVILFFTISPGGLSVLWFAISVDLTLVFAAFLQTIIEAADSPKTALIAIACDVTLVGGQTFWSLETINSDTASGGCANWFLAFIFEVVILSKLNTIQILVTRNQTSCGFLEGKDTSSLLVTSVDCAFLFVIADNGLVDAVEFVRLVSFSDTLSSLAFVSWFASQFANMFNVCAVRVGEIFGQSARGGLLVAIRNLAFQRSVLLQSVFSAFVVVLTLFFAFVAGSISVFTSLNLVADILCTFVLIITGDWFF